jgi:ribonuclease VapC
LSVVLDSSAVLALLWSEPGSEAVASHLGDAMVSAVNLAEVCAKLSDRGIAGNDVGGMLSALAFRTVPFDERQAYLSGELRKGTRAHGLSVGDRACLALASGENAVVVTADKIWTKLGLSLEIQVIR